MDFFSHQEAARRRTFLLVVYYVAAVILIVAAVYLAVAVSFVGFEAKRSGEPDFGGLWNPDLLMGVCGGTLLLVTLGSLYKIAQLREGGRAIARMLGGRLADPNSHDAGERRILNVVEEMAIAAGTAVPEVFVLDDEPGINAFAAGFSPADAVVAVTRGSVRQLTRDELQGVVAHEFSHILNGDMRLNIRLLGVLNGILVIAITGYWIFRVALRSGGGRSSSKQKGSPLPLIVLGLLLVIIGYVGVFFGKLIKSAVSRQREFLADASAVQFTRNPDGIAGALKKIGGLGSGSRIMAPRAAEASHFYFANGLGASLLSLFATHPPLAERIRRIDPSFEGEFETSGPRAGGEEETPAAAPFAPRGGRVDATPEQVVARVGAFGPEHLAYAQRVVAGIPVALAEAVRGPAGARSVVYALLLSRDGKVRAQQLALLNGRTDDAIRLRTAALAPDVLALPGELALPLLDMAIPFLRSLSRPQYDAFMADVEALARADEAIDLFEFTLKRMLERHLAPAFLGARPQASRHAHIEPLLPACAELLSCLAYWGAEEKAEAEQAFRAGIARIETAGAPAMTPVESAGLDRVDKALATLSGASPAIKRQIVAACAACIATDGKVTVEEGELLRSVADSLDCPMPPFVAVSV